MARVRALAARFEADVADADDPGRTTALPGAEQTASSSGPRAVTDQATPAGA